MPGSPNLTEIATTTLRNRGARKMPSHSVKQAKTMSAIAHGWKPKGSAAGIPVKVAKEFHNADAGKKYGHKKKGYDRSSHQPGNPGFNREGKPPYAKYDGGAHKKQPHGKSIGAAPEHAAHRPNQSFAQEVVEHHGKQPKGSDMGKHHGKVGNIDADRRGSGLVEKTSAGQHHKQTHHGSSVGIKNDDRASGAAERQSLGTPHNLSTRCPAVDAHGYGHDMSKRSGVHRMSGHSGAHMIGRRK